MKYILANTLPIICVICSSYLMYKKIDGWGWVLTLAFLSGHTFGGDKDESSKKG